MTKKFTINDNDRELFCLNNEGWWKMFAKAKNKKRFLKVYRADIDAAIETQTGQKVGQ